MVSEPYETVWTFDTENFEIALHIAPEEDDPADSHDPDLFDIEKMHEEIVSGDLTWFRSYVTVRDKESGWVIGSDHLGGSLYETPEDFWTAHRDPDAMNRNSSIMRKAKGENVVI